MAFLFDSHLPTLLRTVHDRSYAMFIFKRSALAVLAALVAAWLLPHLVANWLDAASPATHTTVASESAPVKFAKAR